MIKLKNKKYHTVGTGSKSKRKTKNTTLWEQVQNQIEKQKIPHCGNRSKIK
jgi:lipopolysaccharide export system protein LptC